MIRNIHTPPPRHDRPESRARREDERPRPQPRFEFEPRWWTGGQASFDNFQARWWPGERIDLHP